jgi:hypothetical protein
MNEQEKKPSNPSAFPEPYANDPSSAISHTKGMTLRDYFANSAMQSLIINNSKFNYRDFSDFSEIISKDAYKIADAMLKAREL